MTTATATISYRKTKTGEWVAYGPATQIRAGQYIEITKRSGETKTAYVDRVGREFTVDGAAMVYGYLDPTVVGTSTEKTARPTQRGNVRRIEVSSPAGTRYRTHRCDGRSFCHVCHDED